MQSTPTQSLKQFLTQPDIDGSPAWEFMDGCASQKPMPTLFHSRLQRNLVNYINQHTQQYESIQELRCIVSPFSPVPDIAIIATHRLPNTDGAFNGAPDWVIEIRSPSQSTLTLQNKIIHFLSYGTQIACLIDLTRQQIWVWLGGELPNIYATTDSLPTLETIPTLTVNEVMAMTQRR